MSVYTHAGTHTHTHKAYTHTNSQNTHTETRRHRRTHNATQRQHTYEHMWSKEERVKERQDSLKIHTRDIYSTSDVPQTLRILYTIYTFYIQHALLIRYASHTMCRPPHPPPTYNILQTLPVPPPSLLIVKLKIFSLYWMKQLNRWNGLCQNSTWVARD